MAHNIKQIQRRIVWFQASFDAARPNRVQAGFRSKARLAPDYARKPPRAEAKKTLDAGDSCAKLVSIN
jgi:hypothetical protein